MKAHQPLMKTSEVCALLGCTDRTLREYVRRGLLHPRRNPQHKRRALWFLRDEVTNLARYTVCTMDAEDFLHVSPSTLQMLQSSGRLSVITKGRSTYYDPRELKETKVYLASFTLSFTQAISQLGVTAYWLRQEVESGRVNFVQRGVRKYFNLQELADYVSGSYKLSLGEAADFVKAPRHKVDYQARTGRLRHSVNDGGRRKFHEADLRPLQRG